MTHSTKAVRFAMTAILFAATPAFCLGNTLNEPSSTSAFNATSIELAPTSVRTFESVVEAESMLDATEIELTPALETAPQVASLWSSFGAGLKWGAKTISKGAKAVAKGAKSIAKPVRKAFNFFG